MGVSVTRLYKAMNIIGKVDTELSETDFDKFVPQQLILFEIRNVCCVCGVEEATG